MPTYSYRCTECDSAFDIQQAFTDDSLTVCPHCGGVLRKVFSPIGVSFTGSGFYRNDSRAKPASDKSGIEKSGAEKSGSEKPSSDKSSSDKPSDKPAKKEKAAAASTPSTSSGNGGAANSSAAS